VPPPVEAGGDVDMAEICRRIIADPAAAPLDKFRAHDKLEALQARQSAVGPAEFYADLDGLPDDQVTRELDGLLVADAVRSVLSGDVVNGLSPTDFPATAAVLDGELRARLAEQARRLEAEFEKRRAREEILEEEDPAEDAEPARVVRLLPPPPGIDPARGWARPESALRRPPRPPRLGR
jgi:hypothetical protein